MGEDEAESEYIINFGKSFKIYYGEERYSPTTLNHLDDFFDHFEQNGMNGWKGKVQDSSNVPRNHPYWLATVRKAKLHNLWHVHIGEPKWEFPFGKPYCTSEWVLHYKKISDYEITALELGCHNPMSLPSDEILNEG